MKKLFALAALALMMIASCTPDNKYVINGTIADADGQTVYLRYMVGDSAVLDSAVIANGQFTFTGELDRPYRSGVLLMGNIHDNYNRDVKHCQVALEPGKIMVKCGSDGLNDATIEGGKTQAEMNALNDQLKPVTDKLDESDKVYATLTTQEQRDSLSKALEPLRNQYDSIITNFIKTQPASYLAPSFLRVKMGEMPYEDIKAAYDAFTDDVKLYGDAVDEVKSELDALEKILPGKEAPDFTANDINGKPFTLSSLKGKVVILDFWASWCVPCRKSNPHMLELYKKYHDKGLEMVYVSDDDNAEDKWRDAVKKDGLTGEGFHHVLRGLKWDRSKGLAGMDKTNDISEKYAIHYLPTKFLIDREGKIVCKIGEEEEAKLDERLETLLK